MQRKSLGLCAAAALLAGCGGSQLAPAVPGTMPAARHSGSWMAPDAKSGDLLYITDTVTNELYVFSYPKGTPKGAITGGLQDPAGECVDKSGDVFVANTGANNVYEYAHGGTSPIAVLNDPGYFPVGCSIDPVTGNLAVTNFPVTSSLQGNVVIYKHAKGNPKGNYTSKIMNQMLLCSYDGSGNLFVDGLTKGSGFAFAELRKGGTALTNVTLNQSIGNAGGVEWDGTYVAVGDQTTNTIYQFTISGKKGTVVGSTPLGGASEVFQFWIDG
ncbi:MAG: hypothetical protein WA814_00540, partial [Candidatus Baltobacteraceae bacterium]